MKVKEIMKHIPAFQHVNICEQMKVIGEGRPREPGLEKFGDKTVGLFYIEDNTLKINVY